MKYQRYYTKSIGDFMQKIMTTIKEKYVKNYIKKSLEYYMKLFFLTCLFKIKSAYWYIYKMKTFTIKNVIDTLQIKLNYIGILQPVNFNFYFHGNFLQWNIAKLKEIST